jgi:hypothetical protein
MDPLQHTWRKKNKPPGLPASRFMSVRQYYRDWDGAGDEEGTGSFDRCHKCHSLIFLCSCETEQQSLQLSFEGQPETDQTHATGRLAAASSEKSRRGSPSSTKSVNEARKAALIATPSAYDRSPLSLASAQSPIQPGSNAVSALSAEDWNDSPAAIQRVIEVAASPHHLRDVLSRFSAGLRFIS